MYMSVTTLAIAQRKKVQQSRSLLNFKTQDHTGMWSSNMAAIHEGALINPFITRPAPTERYMLLWALGICG